MTSVCANMESSHRTLRDSSSRAMLAVPSSLVGGSLVQGKSEWKDKSFDTMEHFCCKELDLGIVTACAALRLLLLVLLLW